MDKSEKEELKKTKIVKKSWGDWYNWLINYFPKPVKKQQINLEVLQSNKLIIKQNCSRQRKKIK